MSYIATLICKGQSTYNILWGYICKAPDLCKTSITMFKVNHTVQLFILISGYLLFVSPYFFVYFNNPFLFLSLKLFTSQIIIKGSVGHAGEDFNESNVGIVCHGLLQAIIIFFVIIGSEFNREYYIYIVS